MKLLSVFDYRGSLELPHVKSETVHFSSKHIESKSRCHDDRFVVRHYDDRSH